MLNHEHWLTFASFDDTCTAVDIFHHHSNGGGNIFKGQRFNMTFLD